MSTVAFREWNERVTNAASAFRGSETDRHKRFPSTKVQSTFDRIVYVSEGLKSGDDVANMEAGGTARLDTQQAEKLSDSLSKVSRLGREHVERWVGYWEKRGLFG